MRIRLLISVLLVGAISGCATNIMEPFGTSKSYDELYLRGVFTWWEADPKYKLQKVADSRYSTTIKLIADGQPYDFKFADASWTPGMNCGYLDKVNDQVIILNSTVNSTCDTTDENFKFVPTETGVYEFSIDFYDTKAPSVRIERLE